MTDQPIIRNRYFDSPGFECNLSSSLVDEDFREFHLRAARTERASLHDFGVTQGLAVSGTLGSSILTINPGVAIDRQGRLIVLAQEGNGEILLNPVSDQRQETPVPVTFDVTNYKGADQSTFYLTIQFSEVVRPPSPGDTEHDCGRFEQVPLIRLQDVTEDTPSIDEGRAVVLAFVIINADGHLVALDTHEVVGGVIQTRRLARKTVEHLQIRQSQRSDGPNGARTIADAIAGKLGPDDFGGLRLTVPNESDQILLTKGGGGHFGQFDVRADETSLAGNVRIFGSILDTVSVSSESNVTIKLDGEKSKVGIGTASPEHNLQIGNAENAVSLSLRGPDLNPQANILAFEDNAGTEGRWFRFIHDTSSNALKLTSNEADPIVIFNRLNGKIGIGTTDPETKLEVQDGDVQIEKNGSPKLFLWSRGYGTQQYSIRATNNQDSAGGRKFIVRNEDQNRDDLTIDSAGAISVAKDIRVTGADCAEDFEVVETAGIEPGTVMVITEEGRLQPSSEAYDKKVAGIVSGAGDYQAGIVLDRQKESPRNRLPIALVGKVYCKVDAKYSSIKVGDLLTTSPTLGHAMKATDPLKAFGAVIGKALRPLQEGIGLIPVLIALQ